MIVKDPNVSQTKNSDFISLMENYYEDVSKKFYRGEVLKDIRPDCGYNIGVIPEGLERARDHTKTINQKFYNERPVTQQPPDLDKKWRYAWRVGQDVLSKEGGITGENVIPENFIGNWETPMNNWGYCLTDAVFKTSKMLAKGYGLNNDYFTSKMEGATHLLAPTGSDLNKYNE